MGTAKPINDGVRIVLNNDPAAADPAAPLAGKAVQNPPPDALATLPEGQQLQPTNDESIRLKEPTPATPVELLPTAAIVPDT